MPEWLICLICGRKGTRDFHVLSGDWFTAPGRVSWVCNNKNACGKRAEKAESATEMHR